MKVAFEDATYETVLEAVHRWPLDKQFALVQDVLSSLALEVTPSRTRTPTLSRALGLLVTERPVPSEEEIEQWLDQRRMEKYG